MRSHPLWLLVLLRFRILLREPVALFWAFVFPLIILLAIGLALGHDEPPVLSVAVTDGPGAEVIAARLDASPDLQAARLSREEAMKELRRGRLSLVLEPGTPLQIHAEPRRVEGRAARLTVLNELEQMHGRMDRLEVRDVTVLEPGHRYLDFVAPGVLGFGLISSGLWGVGSALVVMRSGKLLRRLVATPMRRHHFLLSLMLWRGLLAMVEIGSFLVFARLLFGIRVSGSLLAFSTFGLIGALSIGALAVLVASRAQNAETINGVMSFTSMVLVLLSGVFFPASSFPAWMQVLVEVLPSTALTHGLRSILLDGASLLSLWKELAVLGVWGVVPFALALRIFRWT